MVDIASTLIDHNDYPGSDSIIYANERNRIKRVIQDGTIGLDTGSIAVGGVEIIDSSGRVDVNPTATTGNALAVTRNSGAAGTNSPVVEFKQDEPTDNQPTLKVEQDGQHAAIFAQGNYDAAYATIYVDQSAQGASTHYTFLNRGGTTGGDSLFYRNLSSANTGQPVLVVNQANAGDDMVGFWIQQAGGAAGAYISQGGAGPGLEFNSTDLTRGDIKFDLMAANPTNLTEGDVWYNTTDNKYRGYDGTDVVDFHGESAGGAAGSAATATQTFAESTLWTFNHNLNIANPVFTLYDDAGSHIEEYKGYRVTDNQMKFEFGSAVAGSVRAFGAIGSVLGNGRYQEGFTSQTDVTFTHNLGTQYPDFEVYDSSGSWVLPNTAVGVDANNFRMTFSTATSGNAVFLGGTPVSTGIYKSTFTNQTDFTVTHGLGAEDLPYAMYDSTGSAIKPNQVITVDSNNTRFVLGSPESGTVSLVGAATSFTDTSKVAKAGDTMTGSLTIDYGGTSTSLYVDHSNASGDMAKFENSSEGADTCRFIAQRPSATQGSFQFYRNVSSAVSGGPVLKVHQDNASDNQIALYIDQDAPANALYARGQNTNSSFAGVFTNTGVTGACSVQLAQGDVGAGRALFVQRNRTSANTGQPVAVIVQDSATDDQAALYVQQDGTGTGINLQVNNTTSGTGIVIGLDHSSTSSAGIWFEGSGTGNTAFRINSNYHTTASGNGGFVSNSLGTFTATNYLRVNVGGAIRYIPMGTIV